MDNEAIIRKSISNYHILAENGDILKYKIIKFLKEP